MAKTSSFFTPTNSYFIRRFQWQVHLLGNDCACEILSVMMFHYDNRQSNRMMNELIQNASRKRGGRIIETSDWLPYSVTYLREMLLGSHSPNSIKKGIQILIDKSVLYDDVPEVITNFYSNNMNWYRLNVDFINDWLQLNYPILKTNSDIEVFEQNIKAVKPRNSEIGDIAMQVGLYYKHLFGKNTGYLLDNDRLNPIKTHLRKKRTLPECIQAVIGMTFADWYKENDKTEMRFIFKDTDAFERFIKFSENKGVTQEMAIADFQNFQKGINSKYMLVTEVKKPGSNIAIGSKLVYDEKILYRELSRELYIYFKDREVKEILGIVATEEHFKDKYKKVFDADYLELSIIHSIKTFSSTTINEEIQTKITKFCQMFCNLNKVNTR